MSRLLAEMEAVLGLHSGPAVLEAAARTYLSLCGEEMPCCSASRAARDALVQRWVEQLAALLEVRRTRNQAIITYWGDGAGAVESVCLLQGGSFSADDEEKTAEILVALRKLGAFHK